MLAEIYKLTKSPPLPIFRNAISLASPSIRMKSHKKNAKNVQVPTPLNDRQRTFFAMKWLITASKSRSEKRVEERLAREVMRVVDGESEVLRKKMEVHKVAVANRLVRLRSYRSVIDLYYTVQMLLLEGTDDHSCSTTSTSLSSALVNIITYNWSNLCSYRVFPFPFPCTSVKPSSSTTSSCFSLRSMRAGISSVSI